MHVERSPCVSQEVPAYRGEKAGTSPYESVGEANCARRTLLLEVEDGGLEASDFEF